MRTPPSHMNCGSHHKFNLHTPIISLMVRLVHLEESA